MKLIVKLTPNTQPVPFSYYEQLASVVHKMLGRDNKWHDALSMYSISQLSAGTHDKESNCLQFNEGASWEIGAYDREFLSLVGKGLLERKEIFFGMKVENIRIVMPPNFGASQMFYAISPILLKDKLDNRKHITFKDGDYADELLTDKLKHKMLSIEELASSANSLNACFVKEYKNKHTKLIKYNGISNICSVCPVVIEGDRKALQFAWSVGLGNSTGIGFGAISHQPFH